MSGPRLGVMYRRELPPESLASFARTVEAAGLDELWVVEDCFWSGGMTAATAALAATQSLAIGFGIAPAVVRNAAIAAMEIAGIARMFPGRFIAGFGHGVGDWMRQVGAFPSSQLAALDETMTVVRRLLCGERLTFHGSHVDLDDVELVFPPDEVPMVLSGVTGPRSLAVTARAADGVLLPEGSSASYVRAAKAALGDETLTCVVYALFALSDDRAEAVAAVTGAIDHFAAGSRDERLAKLGIVEDVDPATRADRYAIVGDAARCAAAVAELHDAGADAVVLVPCLGTSYDAQLAQVERAGRELKPLFG